MKRDVFIINASSEKSQIKLSLGAAVLLNSLALHQIEAHLIDLLPVPEECREAYFKERIPKSPALFGFGIIAGNHHINVVEKYAKMIIEADPRHIIIYGGPLPSSAPELLLKKCCCKYIIAGEGEFSLPELVKSLEEGELYPEHISGLHYFKNGVYFCKPPSKIKHLEKWSDPDYSHFDMDFYVNYLKETNQAFEVMASRGCVGDCSFCFKFLGAGLSFRMPSAILDEIEIVMDRYNFNKFYFVDENFLQSKKFFNAFLNEKKRRGLEFRFIVQGRIDAIDAQICREGSQHGLMCVSTGIESASQKTLDLIDKATHIEEIEKKIRMLREYDIQVAANFILGFPWDTEEDYKAMIDFIVRNGLEKQSKMSYLCPLPGTRIYIDLVNRGVIEDEYEYIQSLGNIFWERMINLTNMPDSVLDSYYQMLFRLGQRDISTPKSEKYKSMLNLPGPRT